MLSENRKGRSQVQPYSYDEHPIEKSIYLSREEEQLTPPFTLKQHKHSTHNHLQPMVTNTKPLTISQVNTSRQDSSLWDLFSCCREVNTLQLQQDYEDCAVCNRRVFRDPQPSAEQKAEETPYTSTYRMQSRQGQPVQVFYDRVKSHELCGQRWQRD